MAGVDVSLEQQQAQGFGSEEQTINAGKSAIPIVSTKPTAPKATPDMGKPSSAWARLAQIGSAKVRVLEGFAKGVAVSTAKGVVGVGADVSNTIGNAEIKGAKAVGIRGRVGSQAATGKPLTNTQQFGQKLGGFTGPDTPERFAGNVLTTAATVVPGGGKVAEVTGEYLLKQLGVAGVKDLAEKAGVDVSKATAEDAAGQIAKTKIGQQAGQVLMKGGTTVAGRALKAGAEGAGVGAAFGAGGAMGQGANAKQVVKSAAEGVAVGAVGGAASSLLKSGVEKATGRSTVAQKLLKTAGQHQANEKMADERGLPAGDNTKGLGEGKEIRALPAGKLTPSSLKATAEDEAGVNKVASKAKGMGESGAVNPGQAASDIKNLIDKYHEAKESSGNIVKDTTAVRNKAALLQHDAAITAKDFSGSESDRAAADKYLEARGAGLSLPKLSKAQEQIVNNADALKSETDKDKEALAKANGRPVNPTGNGVHRIAIGKGSPLERFMKGTRNSPVNSRSLRTTVDSTKARRLFAVTDEDGNRSVVHIANQTAKNEAGKIVAQGKMVTRFEDSGKTTAPLGRLKFTTDQDAMDKELKPIQRQLDNLDKEKKILSATKGRSTAASQRLSNIEDKTNSLNRDYANTLNKYDINDLDNRKFAASDGKTYTIGQATKDEITKATGQHYVIHPEVAALDDMVRTKQALYNTQVLSKWKENPDFEKIAVETSHSAPKGWKGVDLPQLKGYNFEPHVADTLNSLYGKADTNDDWISQANRQIRNAIVAIPIKHTLNEGVTSLVDRGISSLLPNKALAQSSNILKAMDEVHNFGPLWRQVLESGAHMTSVDSDSFGKMVKTQLDGVFKEPDAVKGLGEVLSSPISAYKAFQRSTVWVAQDVLNMSRIMDRMDKNGGDIDKAIDDTEKFNLTYHVPAKVLGSKSIGNALRGSNMLLFGSYRYDLFRINANYLKSAVKVTDPKAAAKAIDSLAMEALVVAGFATGVKAGIDKLTGNKNAYMSTPGVAGLAEDVWKLATSRETTQQFGSQQLYPAWMLSDGMQVLNNRDSFTDEQIYNPYSSKGQQVVQVGKWLESQLPTSSQANTVERGASGKTVTNKVVGTTLSIAGARFPKNSPAKTEFESLYYDQSTPTYDQVKSQVKAGDTAGAIKTATQYNQQLASSYQQAWNQDHPTSKITVSQAAKTIQQKYNSNWIKTTPQALTKLNKPSTSLASKL